MWGNVKVKTPPEALPLLVAEVKRGLRIDHHEENEFIHECLARAVAVIDGPNGAGLAMMAQTWTLTLDRFTHEIRLPGDGVREVTGVRYMGRDLEWTDLAPADWRLITGTDPARLCPAPGTAWPTTVSGVGVVEIDYTLGAETRAEVNKALLGAVRLLVGHYYENREAVMVGAPATELPLGVQHILAGHRRGVVAG